jgi:hypothetical protein
MKLASIATTIAVLAIGASAQAVNIATWSFEVNTPADLSNSTSISGILADSGVGTASGFHASNTTDWTTPAGNGSVNSLSSNGWAIGDYYQFEVSLAGFQNGTITWDQNRSSTGPSDFKVSVSTDGTNFTDVFNYVVPQVTWTSATPVPSTFGPQSLGVATNNASTVFVRLVATSNPTGTTPLNGTNRVDNIIVDAEAIPEPATMMVLGLGLAAAAARRKRK